MSNNERILHPSRGKAKTRNGRHGEPSPQRNPRSGNGRRNYSKGNKRDERQGRGNARVRVASSYDYRSPSPSSRDQSYGSGKQTKSVIHGIRQRPVILEKKSSVTNKVLLQSNNDNKGSAGGSGSPSLKAYKLINSHSEFVGGGIKGAFGENSSFCAIGVIGKQGVGKTTLLNYLHSGRGRKGPFAPSTFDNILSCSHSTSGTNVALQPDGFIFLDTQPILSPSVLASMVRSEPNLPQDVASYENMNELQSMQSAAFNMSVCHVVLVVMDWIVDRGTVDFIKTTSFLRHCIPDPSLDISVQSMLDIQQTTPKKTSSAKANVSIPEYWPEVIFVFNKVPGSHMNLEQYKSVRTTLDRMYKDQPFVRNCVVAPEGLDEHGKHVNFYVIPADSRSQQVDIGDNYQVLLDRFRYKILSIPTPRWLKPVTEKDWLTRCARIWETIRRSSVINHYNKALQSTSYKTYYYAR